MSDKIALRQMLAFPIFPRWEIVLIEMWKIILASLGWLLFIVIGNVLYISEGCYTFKLGLIGGGIQVLMFGVVLIVVFMLLYIDKSKLVQKCLMPIAKFAFAVIAIGGCVAMVLSDWISFRYIIVGLIGVTSFLSLLIEYIFLCNCWFMGQAGWKDQVFGVASLAGVQILLELIVSLPLALIAGVGVYFDWWSWTGAVIYGVSFMSIFSIFPLPFFLRNWAVNSGKYASYAFHMPFRGDEEASDFMKWMERMKYKWR